MPAQFIPLHFQQNGERAYLQELKLSNINPSDVMFQKPSYNYILVNGRKANHQLYRPHLDGQSMEACELELTQRLMKVLMRMTILKRMLNAYKMLHQKNKWLQGKYKVPILWSDKVEELPNNFNTALQRFRSQKKRLQKDPNLCQHYKDKMQKCIKNGYARKLSNEKIDKTSQRTWYLPHHPVFNEHKPNKI